MVFYGERPHSSVETEISSHITAMDPLFIPLNPARVSPSQIPFFSEAAFDAHWIPLRV